MKDEAQQRRAEQLRSRPPEERLRFYIELHERWVRFQQAVRGCDASDDRHEGPDCS